MTEPTARAGNTSAGRITLPHAPWQNIASVTQISASVVMSMPSTATYGASESMRASDRNSTSAVADTVNVVNLRARFTVQPTEFTR